jgi:hypothetical protein
MEASDGVFRGNLDSPIKPVLSGFVKYANALAQLRQGRVLPRRACSESRNEIAGILVRKAR